MGFLEQQTENKTRNLALLELFACTELLRSVSLYRFGASLGFNFEHFKFSRFYMSRSILEGTL